MSVMYLKLESTDTQEGKKHSEESWNLFLVYQGYPRGHKFIEGFILVS